MRLGTSYRQTDITGGYDVIVIGSGIGGLAAAALLARYGGRRVLVLERHYTAGGFTQTFRRPGYEWDVGVHYVGQGGVHGDLMQRALGVITGGRLQFADMGDVYDRFVIGDEAFEYVKGAPAFADRMKSYFPDEARGIDQYVARITAAVRKSRLFFAEKAVPEFVARLAGGAMRRPLLREARRTTREVLAEITSNPRLAAVLTGQWGCYGLPPAQSSFFMHALVAEHYLGGAAYPVGGAARIAATILPAIRECGGDVFTNAEVSSIVVERGRAVGVRLADGAEIRAPVVVSDAGAITTFRRLVPPEARSTAVTDLVAHQAPSTAHLALYVGLRHTAAELGLSKTKVWVFPGPDHDRNLERYLAEPDAPLPVAVISFESAKDPDFERRHSGRATIEVVSLAPYAWFEKWEGRPWHRRGAEYEELKMKFQERLLGVLCRHCPEVRGKIDMVELSTPVTTSWFTGHPRGAIYGLAATPALFAERGLRPRTALRGLYLTGCDAGTAGLGGALVGAVLCASAVLGRDLTRAVAKEAA
jgi:all-trans-retinol 13,14-reductase